MRKTTNLLVSIALLAFVTLLAGCKTSNVSFPTPSANFTPKGTYAVAYDKLWNATLDALDKNRIVTASADQATGVIETDDIEGTSMTIAFLANESSRYQYHIALRKESTGTVRLNIICKIESTVSGGHGGTPWRDVTSENAARAKSLETWLYEQIEGEIK